MNDEAVTLSIDEYAKLHPADLADRLQRLPVEEAQAILRGLSRPQAASVLTELEEEKRTEMLAGMPAEEVAAFLKELPHDDAADVAANLSTEQQHEALAELSAEERAKVRALMRYPEDTAGGIMSDHFIALRADHRLHEAVELLRARPEPEPEDVSYLYVTDQEQRLQGIVSLRDLVFRRPERRISEIMNPDVTFVRVDADQEEIARQFEHYHYLALPVLEGDGRLVGIVRANDVLKIAQAEATEDMQLMVGLSGEERALSPWQRSVGKRLPWLMINLATAFLAAAVVNLFESTIAKWTVLAVFLPIIAGQGGNAGIQTLTVIIRDLALGEITLGDGRKALLKELLLGLINGVAIGLVVGLAGFVWKGDPRLGLIAGLAMVLNMIAAALSGVLIPYTLKALRVDPALASGILLTTVTDVAGFFFFLGLAALGLYWFG